MDAARQFPHGLAHETCLESHLGISHLAVDLRAGNERRHGVDHDRIHSPALDEHVRYLEVLFSIIGLRDEKVFRLHPQASCIDQIQGVLGVDEGRDASRLLGLCHDVQCQGRLPGAFRSEDLHDPAARDSANTQCHIQAE